ncbi:MAG: hypothetical protein P8L45_02540, partial [Longimicrobiales bacterium]|nr:hypothetical protein [Longimicrobiales bacterium]
PLLADCLVRTERVACMFQQNAPQRSHFTLGSRTGALDRINHMQRYFVLTEQPMVADGKHLSA